MSSLLVKIGKERFAKETSQLVHFVDDDNANSLLNDIENYPHAYVLACLMDRQIKAERAWVIPFEIYKEIGSFNFDELEEDINMLSTNGVILVSYGFSLSKLGMKPDINIMLDINILRAK